MTREDSYKAQYRFKKDGKRHILIYSEVTLEDKGRYRVMTNGGQCEADRSRCSSDILSTLPLSISWLHLPLCCCICRQVALPWFPFKIQYVFYTYSTSPFRC